MRKRMVFALALLAALAVADVQAQECEDFGQCTANGMCSDGACVGTPLSGNTCDDFNECTADDRCVNGECTGTPVRDGTPCETGNACRSGTCRQGECMPDTPSRDDDPCEDVFGPCTTNDRCQSGFCVGDLIECPDVDDNPCTFEFCNILTGACEGESVPVCDGCEICNPATGECESANDGVACDDFNDCTANDRCQDGFCQGRPTLGPCYGDCGNDGKVAISDLVLGVGIALGTKPYDACPAFDRSGNRKVEINELIAAVKAALKGCTGPP